MYGRRGAGPTVRRRSFPNCSNHRIQDSTLTSRTLSIVVSSPIVSLRGIGVRFGTTRVLTDIDIDIDPGTALGITGPNGAGKTTLLDIVATVLRPSEGSGTVFGVPLGDRDIRLVRRRIGMSGHEPGVYQELTLAENLDLVERLAGTVTMSSRQVLDVVGLGGASNRKASEASNGMLRRTDLARLLMTRPDLILLDEAHAGLDRSARDIVSRLIDLTCAAGGAAVVVSHDAAVLTDRVDRIVTITEGRVR